MEYCEPCDRFFETRKCPDCKMPQGVNPNKWHWGRIRLWVDGKQVIAKRGLQVFRKQFKDEHFAIHNAIKLAQRLDKEPLEWAREAMVAIWGGTVFQCQHCKYQWRPKKARPKSCPSCGKPWNCMAVIEDKVGLQYCRICNKRVKQLFRGRCRSCHMRWRTTHKDFAPRKPWESWVPFKDRTFIPLHISELNIKPFIKICPVCGRTMKYTHRYSYAKCVNCYFKSWRKRRDVSICIDCGKENKRNLRKRCMRCYMLFMYGPDYNKRSVRPRPIKKKPYDPSWKERRKTTICIDCGRENKYNIKKRCNTCYLIFHYGPDYNKRSVRPRGYIKKRKVND